LAINREKDKTSIISISLFLLAQNKNIRILKVQPADNRDRKQHHVPTTRLKQCNIEWLTRISL